MNNDMGRSWKYTVFAGLLTLVTSLWLFGQFPHDFASPSESYRDPIMAFEFAQTQEDLLEIFGGVDDPERMRRQDGMDNGHDGDLLFLIIYSLFIAGFFTALFKKTGRAILLAGVAVAAVAAVGDIWENSILRSLTRQLEHPGDLLADLHFVTWIKWWALALGASLGSYGLFKDGRIVLAIMCLPGFFLAVPAYLQPKIYATLFVDSIGLWFIAMLVAAALNLRAQARE